MCCGHAVESCGSEWFQSALIATISTTFRSTVSRINLPNCSTLTIYWHKKIEQAS